MDLVKGFNALIVMFLFLFCGSVYPIIFGANLLFILFLLVGIISLLLQKKFTRVHLISFSKSVALCSLFLTVNWFLSGFDSHFIEFPIMYGLIIIINIALLALINKDDLSIYKFDFFFNILVIHSLLNLIFTHFFKSLFVPFISDSYSVNHFFYIFFYLSEHSLLGLDLVRNQSFYWEPGVLSVVLNIFLFRLLFGERRSFRNTLIFLTSFLIFTTFSTTGLLVMFLQFVYFFIKMQGNKVTKIFVLLLFLGLSIPVLLSNVNEKVSGKGEGSFLIRNYDALVSLDVTKDNFFTGVGFSVVKNKQAQEKSEIYLKSDNTEARGNTNSVITVFLYLGVPLGLIYFFMFYNQIIIEYNKGFFFFIMLICLASEPLVFSGFFMFFAVSYFYRLKIVY